MSALSQHQSDLTALRDLKATCGISEAGAFFGLSRPHAYRLAAAGEFPVEIIRVGARMTVRTADLARALGIDPSALLTSD